MAGDDFPYARTSDPVTSHIANAAIAKDTTLAGMILDAAKQVYPCSFDDTDLTHLIEERTGRRQQRNVIARARGLLERDGHFIRIGPRQRIADARPTMHFLWNDPNSIANQMTLNLSESSD